MKVRTSPALMETMENEPTMERTKMQGTLADASKSSLQKYQELVVGSTGMTHLLKHELIASFIGLIPGALGLGMRKLLFPRLLGSVGKNVAFGRSMTLRHAAKIYIGDGVTIDDYTVLDAKGSDNIGIDIGAGVFIGRNSVLSCKDGNITIGQNANIAMNCFIQSAQNVTIGSNVLISAFCYLIGGGDHRADDPNTPIIAQGQKVRGIEIGDGCLIGAGVNVLDGVVVGKDSIIGSGAVVTRDIPPSSVAAGVPAKVIRERI